jgi:hypothetical protein
MWLLHLACTKCSSSIQDRVYTHMALNRTNSVFHTTQGMCLNFKAKPKTPYRHERIAYVIRRNAKVQRWSRLQGPLIHCPRSALYGGFSYLPTSQKRNKHPIQQIPKWSFNRRCDRIRVPTSVPRKNGAPLFCTNALKAVGRLDSKQYSTSTALKWSQLDCV